MYAVTVDVHKCICHSHHHPGLSVHRLNTPSKESQWSWHYSDNVRLDDVMFCTK